MNRVQLMVAAVIALAVCASGHEQGYGETGCADPTDPTHEHVCDDRQNVVCNTTGIGQCVCKEGANLNDNVCDGTLGHGGACNNSGNAFCKYSEHFVCVLGQCDCKSGFEIGSTHQCVSGGWAVVANFAVIVSSVLVALRSNL